MDAAYKEELMENIIEIKGNVKFNITLDLGVWIFDDRKAELETFFAQQPDKDHELEQYTLSISKHWDREITEGAKLPQEGKTEKKYIKETLLTGTFAIPFEPFLKNSEPREDAKTIVIETINKEYPIAIENGSDIILCFSHNGKPLKEDGPVHIYFKSGSIEDQPIKHIKCFRIE